MYKRYANEIKKVVMMLLCIAIAALLAWYSNLDFPKLIVVAMIIYAIGCWKFKRMSNLLIWVMGIILCVYTGMYFVKTVLPIREKYDATQNQQLTQLSIPENWENSEMWISPIVKEKTVDLTYADEWCYAYLEEFAGAVEISKNETENIKEMSASVIEKYFFRLNEHRFSGTRDFFDKELLSEMYNGEDVGHLFVATEGLAEANKVYVITDATYNVYLMSEEILDKVLDENEN